jgi:hypothetical protein
MLAKPKFDLIFVLASMAPKGALAFATTILGE